MSAFFKTAAFELNLFWIALAFLTRLPIPSSVDFSQENLNRASRYFPLVGWLVGFICASVFLLAHGLLPLMPALLISMLVSVLLTGCFHEDGLADTCDGLGGAFETEKKLLIMKDSRLGTYGATSLWFVLSLKLALLLSLAQVGGAEVAALALVLAHPLSRMVSILLMTTMSYVTDPEGAKVKPLAQSLLKQDAVVIILSGAAALLFVPAVAFWLLMFLAIFYWGYRRFLLAQIGGYSGDTLGAAQQLSELLIYTVLLVQVSAL